MLGREPAAIVLGDSASFGDADQRIMRFIVVAAREIRFVGRDQRQCRLVGQLDQAGSVARSSASP